MQFTKTQLLFFIILTEGYIVLACELLAIRQLVPFVGSGTDTISIIISSVLLPLAIGYHFGGNAYTRSYQRSNRNKKLTLSVRKILLRNILTSLGILGIGLSLVCMEFFFNIIEILGIKHRLLQTALYCLLFLVWPVYLLGQTVPLISNYFSRKKLSEITGKMLFFSTAGSFLGSVFSTLILMSYVGVHNTVIITLGLLFILVLLLKRRFVSYEVFLASLCFAFIIAMNNNSTMKALHIVSNNAYNTAIVINKSNEEDTRLLILNRSYSSQISDAHTKQLPYIDYISKIFLRPIRENGQPKHILVLGAGGFTLGLDDEFNEYTYVDIDDDLKKVAEKEFLKHKLTPNKKFVAASARAFVHSSDEKYDFVVIDVYTNVISIPMETITREFLIDVKNLLKPEAIVVSNVLSSPNMSDKFTVRYNNTFASVFPSYTRQVIDDFDPWNNNAKKVNKVNNALYIYYQNAYSNDASIYTDDKNTYSIDRY